jgi:hypothetical protein
LSHNTDLMASYNQSLCVHREAMDGNTSRCKAVEVCFGWI